MPAYVRLSQTNDRAGWTRTPAGAWKRHDEPPFYGLVTRDGVGLNLRWVPSPPIPPVLREQESLLSANIVVDGVKALYLDLQRRGADFAQTLKEQPWAATDFIVRDLDGNRICFASPTRDVRQDPGDVRRTHLRR